MKLIKQTKEYDPVKGVNANCLRACIASILEIDLDSMPPFEDLDQEWMFRLRRWMKVFNSKAVIKKEPSNPPRGFSIAAGPTNRSLVTHYVVAFNGHVIHDPHPSNDGLTRIDSYWSIALLPEKLKLAS